MSRAALAAALLAVLAGGACGTGTGGSTFASAPFVQNVSETGATIAMVSATPVRLAIEVAPAHDEVAALARVAEEADAGTIHAVRLTGLAPDTLYRYRVIDAGAPGAAGAGGAALGEATFRTAPPPGRRAVVFAAVGDTGRTNEATDVPAPFVRVAKRIEDDASPPRMREVALALLAQQPDLCLHLGDIVYPAGERSRYAEAFFRPFAPLLATTPMFPAIGNHDVRAEGGAAFDDAFDTPANNPEGSERYYSFGFGDVHFVVLDSASPGALDPAGPQVAWLADDLGGPARATRAWTVVAFHHPPFAVGRSAGEERVRATIVPLLEAFGVDLVLSGHDHNYARFLPRAGVTYVVAGGGGAGLYAIRDLHDAAVAEAVVSIVVGRATATRLDLTAVDLTGRVFDAVTLLKDGPEGAPR